MAFTYKFEKILQIREREKEEAAISYEQAVRRFEEVGRKLYELLKKKETIEELLASKMNEGISIQEIQIHRQYVQNMQKEINQLQLAVISARQTMQYEEQKLQERNFEVKKFEKLKEKAFDTYKHELQIEEDKQLNEIAMQVIARGKS